MAGRTLSQRHAGAGRGAVAAGKAMGDDARLHCNRYAHERSPAHGHAKGVVAGPTLKRFFFNKQYLVQISRFAHIQISRFAHTNLNGCGSPARGGSSMHTAEVATHDTVDEHRE